MDTRDIYKMIRAMDDEHEETMQLYDSIDIELTDDFVIETGIVGFTEDGIIIHLDEDAMEMLDFNGILVESDEVSEGLGKSLLGLAAVLSALIGVNKMQADQMLKTEPQLVKLVQLRQAAEEAGDQQKVDDIDDRIEQTIDHIRVTGSPVRDDTGREIVPGEPLGEAEYQGRKVPLNKPMKGDVKKSKVYVKNAKGNVVKVNFGDKNMRIKKSNPGRRKSFRARHNCDNPGPKWKARYWSCKAW